MRQRRRPRQRLGVGQPALLGLERLVLAGLRARPPRSRRDRTAARRARGSAPARGCAARRGCARRSASRAYDGRVLAEQRRTRRRRTGRAPRAARRAQQAVLVGLAVHGDELRRSTSASSAGRDRRRRRRRRGSVPARQDRARRMTTSSSIGSAGAPRARPARPRRPADADGRLDAEPVGTAADEARVGAITAQQPERRHDHRLACAGLARDDGEALGPSSSSASSMTPSEDNLISCHTGYAPEDGEPAGHRRHAPARSVVAPRHRASRSPAGRTCGRAGRRTAPGAAGRGGRTSRPAGPRHGRRAAARTSGGRRTTALPTSAPPG